MIALGSRTGHGIRRRAGGSADLRFFGLRTLMVVVAAALVLSAGAARLHAEMDVKLPPHKRAAGPAARTMFAALAEVPEVEPNDHADQAQLVGCGNSLRPASLTNAADRDTDWVALTANANDLITVETAADGPPETDTVISLIAMDGTTILATNDDAFDGTTPFSRIADFPAPYSGLYYVRIRGLGGAEGPYRANVLCAPPPPVPANDRCLGAIEIACGPIALSGTTVSALDDYDLCPGGTVCPTSCTGFPTPGRDVVYQIEGHQGDTLDVIYELDPAGTDASVYLVTDCSDVVASCMAGQDSDVGTPPEHLVHVFTQSGTHYLILDAFTSGGAKFTLTGSLGCGATLTAPMTWGRLKLIYR